MARSLTQQVASRRKEALALTLRQEGHSYDEIAQRVGYANRSAAYKAVHRALVDVIRQPAEDLRRLEMERLEELVRVLWPVATDATDPSHLRAIEKLLLVMDHMERISGLAHKKVESRRRQSTPELPPGVVLVIQNDE